MKKLLLSFSLLTVGFSYAQEYYPNSIVPLGWVHPMNEEKIVKDPVTNEGAFMSLFNKPGTAADLSYSEAGNSVKIEKKDEVGAFSSVSFSPFQDTDMDPIESTVDISNSPYVYLRMKGDIDTKVTVSLKDNSYNPLMGSTDWDKDAYNESIVCEDYRWYKFDYSGNSNSLDGIKSIELVINNGVNSSALLWIDSLILGDANYEPSIPKALAELRWDFSLDVPWFTSADPNGTPIEDNVLELDTGNFFKAIIAATSGADKGVQFSINDGSVNSTLDISENAAVRAMIKGSVGDTVRINLFNGSSFAWVDSYQVHVFTTNDYEEVILDYSAVAGELTEASLVEMVLNPSSQVSGEFFIKELTVGDYDADGCEAPVVDGLASKFNTKTLIDVYPNPVNGGLVNFGKDLHTVSVIDAMGVLRMTYDETSSLDVSSLEAGMYIIHSEEGFVKLLVK